MIRDSCSGVRGIFGTGRSDPRPRNARRYGSRPRWPVAAWGLLSSIAALGCATSGDARATAVPRVAAYQDGPVQVEHGDAGHGEDNVGHEGHGKGSQAFNVFAGGSGEIGDKDGWTFGVDYEYRLSEPLGIGAFAELVTGLDRSFATGVQLYWHAIGDLVLVAGPGLERHHDEWLPLARLGGFYEFPLGGGWVLSPALFYDIVEGDDFWIFGLNLGFLW